MLSLGFPHLCAGGFPHTIMRMEEENVLERPGLTDAPEPELGGFSLGLLGSAEPHPSVFQLHPFPLTGKGREGRA